MYKLCVIYLLIFDCDGLFELGNFLNIVIGIVDCFGELIFIKLF